MVQENIQRKTVVLVLRLSRVTERAMMAAIRDRVRAAAKEPGKEKSPAAGGGRKASYGDLTKNAVMTIDLSAEGYVSLLRAGRKHGVSLEARRSSNGDTLLFVTGRGSRSIDGFLGEIADTVDRTEAAEESRRQERKRAEEEKELQRRNTRQPVRVSQDRLKIGRREQFPEEDIAGTVELERSERTR